MCYTFSQTLTVEQVQARFNAKVEEPDLFIQNNNLVGFTFPDTPVIIDDAPDIITQYQWGLLPFFVTDPKTFRKKTNLLNAKIETVGELNSFKHSVENRCLILASSFYEWKWMDEKGKIKVKHEITVPGGEPFAFAGLYNAWTNKNTGEVVNTYTILTTEANELMALIHNSKKRMPVVLRKEEESLWLNHERLTAYSVRDEVELIATPLF